MAAVLKLSALSLTLHCPRSHSRGFWEAETLDFPLSTPGSDADISSVDVPLLVLVRLLRLPCSTLRFAELRLIGRRSLLHFLLLALLTCGLVLAVAAPSRSELSLTNPTQQMAEPPLGVQRFGEIEVAPVRFGGVTLFEVVSPTVRDRTQSGTAIPVEVRATIIQQNLERVIKTDSNWRLNFPPFANGNESRAATKATKPQIQPADVVVSLLNLGDQVAMLATNGQREKPLTVLTVTPWDADYYGISVAQLASQWQGIVQQHLRDVVEERLPAAFYRQLRQAGLVAVGLAIASLVVWLGQRLLAAQVKQLRSRQQEQLQTLETAPPTTDTTPVDELPATSATADSSTAVTPTSTHQWSDLRDGFLANQREKILLSWRKIFSLERQLSVNALLQWLLNWGLAVLWLAGCFRIILIFPFSRGYAGAIFGVPILLLAIWFLTGLTSRIGDVVIDQLTEVWDENTLFAFENNPRKSLRFTTTVRAMKGLKSFVVYAIGLTWALAVIGVPISSVLAGGAILAFALSFGFQNVVKDLVNGCLILWEDQYAIGDVIAVGQSTGLVENMNLRVTQIRNGEGRLITIPNSSIVQVENLTRSWSRVDFSIEVAYETDVKKAMGILQQVAEGLYTDTVWRDRILEAPEVLGIETLSHTGMGLRVMIKTQPGQQWAVGRELRLRVRLAMDQQNIDIGTPQQTLTIERSH